MKRRAVALAGLIGLCFGGEAAALTRRMVVERDKPKDVGSFYTIRRDCFTKPATVAVLEPPKHGVLTFKEADWTLGPGVGVVDRCIGRTGRGLVATYTPAKGYVGSDTYRVRATYVSDSTDYDVDVQVRDPQPKKDPTAGGWSAPH